MKIRTGDATDKMIQQKLEDFHNYDPLKPSVATLVKLGSIAVHVEELLSSNGHHFDREALLSLCKDSDVTIWRMAMDKMALLPVKR